MVKKIINGKKPTSLQSAEVGYTSQNIYQILTTVSPSFYQWSQKSVWRTDSRKVKYTAVIRSLTR
jgi:hypothetical protein